jgi:hypothetical protein
MYCDSLRPHVLTEDRVFEGDRALSVPYLHVLQDGSGAFRRKWISRVAAETQDVHLFLRRTKHEWHRR